MVPATVTICVHWVSGGQAKIECADQTGIESEENLRARVLRKAEKRMTEYVGGLPPEPPDHGSELTMERLVGNLSTPWASVTVTSNFEETYAAFVAACDHS